MPHGRLAGAGYGCRNAISGPPRRHRHELGVGGAHRVFVCMPIFCSTIGNQKLKITSVKWKGARSKHRAAHLSRAHGSEELFWDLENLGMNCHLSFGKDIPCEIPRLRRLPIRAGDRRLCRRRCLCSLGIRPIVRVEGAPLAREDGSRTLCHVPVAVAWISRDPLKETFR
jgi:hypothetical protein